MSAPPIELFYSYADSDENLQNELDRHLSLLQRQGLIAPWHKGSISLGIDKEDALDEHLNRASIILLLISADFLACDSCGREMERAMKRHDTGEAYVMPILLRPVNCKGAPFEKLQVLPSNGQAITQWDDRDSAFTDISQNIRFVVQGLRQKAKPFFQTTIFRLSLVFLVTFGLIVPFYPKIAAQIENTFLPTLTSIVVKQGITKVLVPDPKQTLEKYCQYLKDGNSDSLYDLFATDSPMRESKTRAQADQEIQNELNNVKNVNTCIVNNDFKEDNNTATGTVTVIEGTGEVLNEEVFLKQESYEWKIIGWKPIT